MCYISKSRRSWPWNQLIVGDILSAFQGETIFREFRLGRAIRLFPFLFFTSSQSGTYCLTIKRKVFHTQTVGTPGNQHTAPLLKLSIHSTRVLSQKVDKKIDYKLLHISQNSRSISFLLYKSISLKYHYLHPGMINIIHYITFFCTIFIHLVPSSNFSESNKYYFLSRFNG